MANRWVHIKWMEQQYHWFLHAFGKCITYIWKWNFSCLNNIRQQSIYWKTFIYLFVIYCLVVNLISSDFNYVHFTLNKIDFKIQFMHTGHFKRQAVKIRSNLMVWQIWCMQIFFIAENKRFYFFYFNPHS